MDEIIVNAASAVAIGAVIVAMAITKNSVLKAIIYGLPIPISVALVSTKGLITSNHVIGLFLLNLFLWSVSFTYRRWRNIFLSDLIGAIGYVVIGYALISHIRIGFFEIVFLYVALWLVFSVTYGKRALDEEIESASRVGPGVKFAATTLLSFALLSAKGLLTGLIVTFPFSGVFAVIEGKEVLKTIAVKFTQNSPALLFFFVIVRLSETLSLGVKIALGWVAYSATLLLLNRLFKRLGD